MPTESIILQGWLLKNPAIQRKEVKCDEVAAHTNTHTHIHTDAQRDKRQSVVYPVANFPTDYSEKLPREKSKIMEIHLLYIFWPHINRKLDASSNAVWTVL